MIRRLVVSIFVLSMAGAAHAFTPVVWKSSFTPSAVTTKNLCVNQNGFLHSVCVSSPTAAPSLVSVYNSSGSAVNPIAIIDGTKYGCFEYDVLASTANKGLTYSNSSTANITIMYQCY